MSLKLLAGPFLSSLVLPLSIVNLINVNSSKEIVLATYQSYISDEIAMKANSSYGIQTTYFENDREILNGFQTGAYDLAIMSSSTLEEAIKKKIVKPIDWEKFDSLKELLKKNENNGSQSLKEKNWGNVFSPIVTKFFEKKPELSNYGLPYFLSYLLFAYRCNECDQELKNLSSSNWTEKFQKIIKSPEFTGKSGSPFRLGVVEDEVTILSLSKLADSKSLQDENSWNLGREDFYNFYEKYKNLSKLGIGSSSKNSSIFLNSDSALLSEMFVKNKLQGVFMYNGDALYSYQELKEKQPEKSKDFKILEPFPSLWLLDQVAISSKVSREKEDKIYKFLEKLLFQGAVRKSQANNDQEVSAKKDSWAWKNFEFLGYTPALKSMQEEIKKEHQEGKSKNSQEGNQYDDLTIKLLFGEQDNEKCLLTNSEEKSHTEEKKCKILFESGMTDSQNLDLALSFQRWKNNWF